MARNTIDIELTDVYDNAAQLIEQNAKMLEALRLVAYAKCTSISDGEKVVIIMDSADRHKVVEAVLECTELD